MRFAIKIAYDGRGFYGFARQPHITTIEGEIQRALLTHHIISSIDTAVFRVGSRTDKNVSSLGTVIACNTDKPLFECLPEINTKLSHIYYYGVSKVSDDFNPRYAQMRSYRYFLKKNSSLDFSEMILAATYFTGTHNFRNFARIESHRTPIRTIENIVLTEMDRYVVIDIFAQTFLWHQVRRIISALEKIGLHRISISDIQAALDNPEKPVDFGLAPAEPLLLTDIIYKFSFQYLKGYQKRLQQLESSIISDVLL
ncbi:MAG: tRNA pseudouridine(38-40) synthase TruA [Candidatus Thermoplasmatota archaeon]|nr:tRNA pseudouridine(38-40) synthase TruA [Candidatus Thermoplasmatota archaeon]MBU1940225.1 tRNA pseudouridine(38-40) synthase TruA [Candidatus Thermoplasmatota archaeon]